jgi:hypothetical protein
MERTDPKNLQPQLSRAVREAEALVRQNRPAEMTDTDHQRLCDTLAARFEPRVERAFTAALKAPSMTDRVKAVVQVIDAFGLTPPESIKELPEIVADDIHLVAWTALVA